MAKANQSTALKKHLTRVVIDIDMGPYGAWEGEYECGHKSGPYDYKKWVPLYCPKCNGSKK